nr:protein CASC2-like [Macaca nemestrina]
MLLGPGPVAGPGDVAEAGRLSEGDGWDILRVGRRALSHREPLQHLKILVMMLTAWPPKRKKEPEKCMTQEKMHPHLFSERCANQHQHRTAEEKKMCVYVSGKQLIHWRCEESSTHHNSIDIKYMKHFRSALRLRQTFHLNTANHPCVITMNSALAWKLEGSNSTSALPLAA